MSVDTWVSGSNLRLYGLQIVRNIILGAQCWCQVVFALLVMSVNHLVQIEHCGSAEGIWFLVHNA